MTSETGLASVDTLIPAGELPDLAGKVVQGRGGCAAGLYEELALVAVPLTIDLAPCQGTAAMRTIGLTLIGQEITFQILFDGTSSDLITVSNT